MKKKTKRGPSIGLIIVIILCVTTIAGAAGWGYTAYKLKGANELMVQMQEKILDFEATITELEERINTAESDKATIQSDMEALKGQKETLESEKAGLETELNNVKTQLEDLKKQIDEGQILSSNYYGTRPEKIVALTFDDGPGPYTERLLEELKTRDVKATFFVLGSRAEQYTGLIKRMALEGHEIGNHSYDHTVLTKITKQDASDNLLKSSEAIYNASGGITPKLVRPPGGNYNGTIQDICKENNWSIALWSLDTRDWESRNETAILDAVFNHGQYSVKDGSILLLHDIYETSVNASLELIDRLKAEGYTLVTVSELLYWDNGGAEAGNVYN